MKANSQSAIVSISSESMSKRWDLFRGRNGGKESWVGISAGAHTHDGSHWKLHDIVSKQEQGQTTRPEDASKQMMILKEKQDGALEGFGPTPKLRPQQPPTARDSARGHATVAPADACDDPRLQGLVAHRRRRLIETPPFLGSPAVSPRYQEEAAGPLAPRGYSTEVQPWFNLEAPNPPSGRLVGARRRGPERAGIGPFRRLARPVTSHAAVL